MRFLIPSAYWNFTGYSIAVRELGYAMSKYIDVKFISPSPGNSFVPEKLLSLISSPIEIKESDILFFRPYFENISIGYSNAIGNVVLESTKLPERLVKECNDSRIKSIWTPSTFCKKNYIESGVREEKIKVIPHGFNPEEYHIKNNNNNLYTFLFLGGYAGVGDRKGADMLAQAFSEEFTSDDKVKLYLKLNTSYNPGVDLSIFDRILKNHDYELDTKMALPNTLADIYAIGDCFVAPSFGEGFNMTVLEALACGLPVITSIYGGQSDYLPIHKNVQVITSGDYISAKFSQWDCGLWFKPSMAQLKSKMRKAYESKHTKSKYDNIEDWTWDNAAKKAVEALNEM